MPDWRKGHEQFRPIFYSFMKQLKFRTFIIAMLLASAMGVSAEKVEAIVGDLKYEIDTETKDASVIKGDYSGGYGIFAYFCLCNTLVINHFHVLFLFRRCLTGQKWDKT